MQHYKTDTLSPCVCVCFVLTSEQRVELQGVELRLLHTAALEVVWSKTPAGEKSHRLDILH